MKHAHAVLAAVSVAALAAAADPAAEAVFSGNAIRLYTDPLSYEVVSDGATLVPKTPLTLSLDGREVASAAKPVSVETKRVSGEVATPVYKKSSVSLEGCETLADFGDFAVRLAARADGAAWRFELKKAAEVTDEGAALTVPAGAECWFNRTSTPGCEETVPESAKAGELPSDAKKFYYMPFYFSVGGKSVAVSDSDVREYPFWYFSGRTVRTEDGGSRLVSTFSKHPASTRHVATDKNWKRADVPEGGRWIKVVEREPWLAKCAAPRTLPWRVFSIASSPAKLCESDAVYALAAPADPAADFSWVKPGKVAWEWWNAFDNKGDVKGCTTETYLRFIDFAAKNGVEYVIMDEGWSWALDIWKFNPAVDVPAIVKYADSKNVGIILWMAWAQVYGDEDRVAEHFSKVGAKGFKVDFIDRDDADAAAFMERFAAACAKRRMLLDYHGACRPAGLSRKYPNILNYEGIHGLEQLKWAKPDKDMPYNDVAAFFLRMSAGQMDYTPGAMDNYRPGSYAGNWENPGSVGTRVHQMALMALYEAPLQMLCDSPTKYEKNMECFSFMAKTPTVWEKTVGLGGRPGSMAAVARKAKDGAWHAAGITDGQGRDYVLDTSFLEPGIWDAEIFRDGPGAAENATEYVHERRVQVRSGDKLSFRMAPGGGFAANFRRAPAASDGAIAIWPEGKMPGAATSAPERADGDSEFDGKGKLFFYNVSRPLLATRLVDAGDGPKPAVLILPGGGYAFCSWANEGEEVARWFNSIGYQAFILKYRVPDNRDGALMDAQRALSLIRANAAEWGVDPAKVGIIGGSAGANLAARVSCNFGARSYEPVDDADKSNIRPDFTVLVYPWTLAKGDNSEAQLPVVLRQEFRVTHETPPAFIIQSEDDGAHVENSLAYYLACKRAAVPAEMHLFATGGHGYGMRPSGDTTGWQGLLARWLRGAAFRAGDYAIPRWGR